MFSSATVHADTYTGTMCANFNPNACGCSGGCHGSFPLHTYYLEANEFDDPVTIYTPAPGTNLKTKLLVFLHGHGGSPGNNVAFLQRAAALGYDVIALDYDYGRDYQQAPAGNNMYPGDAQCANPMPGTLTCGMSIDRVCGCFTNCYGQRDSQIAFGGSSAGLPTTHADWSIQSRLVATLQWLHLNANTQPEKDRFGVYLNGSLPNWPFIVMTGHSLGTSMAAFIGANRSVDRVILFSGMCEKLFPDGNYTSSNFGSAFGCTSNVGTDENGNAFTFTGASCSATTYGFTNSAGHCTLKMTPTAWMSQITHPGKFFFLQDSNDLTCNWFTSAGKPGQNQINNLGAHIDQQHLSGYADNFNYVGDYSHWYGLQAGGYHGVVSSYGTPFVFESQICSLGGGHNAVISDTACANSTETSHRTAIWDFMLTAPTM
ncbi:MAG: hypothetical protein QM723_35040 [Myxococcaceae bacterium]